MVITPLYLVLLARRVVFAPKGLRVAVSPSELRLTTTSVICVWVPSELTLKSLKVVVLTVGAHLLRECGSQVGASSHVRGPAQWRCAIDHGLCGVHLIGHGIGDRRGVASSIGGLGEVGVSAF